MCTEQIRRFSKMPFAHAIGITIPYRVAKAVIWTSMAWFTHQDLVALPGRGSHEVTDARLVCDGHRIEAPPSGVSRPTQLHVRAAETARAWTRVKGVQWSNPTYGPGPTTLSRKDRTLANRLAVDVASWALLADRRLALYSKVAPQGWPEPGHHVCRVLKRLWIPLVIVAVVVAGGLTVSRLHGIFGSRSARPTPTQGSRTPNRSTPST